MKSNGSVRRLPVSADECGVVSHVGLAMLRELAEHTGLVEAIDDALKDSYSGAWAHSSGQVLTDLAMAVADGADPIIGIQVLGDREGVFGPVASMPTAWRVLDRVDAEHLRACVQPGPQHNRCRGRQEPARTWARNCVHRSERHDHHGPLGEEERRRDV